MTSFNGTHRYQDSVEVYKTRSSPASENEQIAIASVVIFLGIWTTLGNLLTIAAICLAKRMMTKCNLFILSLAISDLISGLIASPLWLYRRTWGFNDWEWGDFLCKLFWFSDQSTSFCTAMHIAAFAVWRFIGVKWPSLFEKIKMRTVTIWLIFIWVVSIIFGGFIFSSFYEVAEKSEDHHVGSCWPMCSIRIENDGVTRHLVYYTVVSSLFMLLPMLILLVTSFLIVWEIYCHPVVATHKSKQRKTKEKRAAVQLALISASFLIGYIPMTSYVMWTTRTRVKNVTFDYWFHVAAFFCLRLSECFNPVLYNIASVQMRHASREVLVRIRTCQYNRERTPRLIRRNAIIYRKTEQLRYLNSP
ncbi:growth hormone secretagogue receptor type 1-like isoform X1 [Ciona intestinalis]